MRMRFWATIRRPAFSISAFTAPVRLRAVASGLMIEKVRSVAILVLKLTGCGGGRAYIGDPLARQAPEPVTAGDRKGRICKDLMTRQERTPCFAKPRW